MNSSRNCLVSINWQPRETSINYSSQDWISPGASQSPEKFKVRLWLYQVGQILLTLTCLLLSCKVFSLFLQLIYGTFLNYIDIFHHNTPNASSYIMPKCFHYFSFYHGPLAENGLLYWEKSKTYFDTGIWEHSLFKV